VSDNFDDDQPVDGDQDGSSDEAAQSAAAPDAEAQEEADPVAAYKAELRRLPGDWYVVHSCAGYENRVRANLESRTGSLNMEDFIFQRSEKNKS